ncbi:MAG TPA: M56 family metallopeptidase, partial [Thermoanaerobaculia bacterium]|nr:M56 family metallopeptidase [Thermoanaerobaculia bacterium]
FAWLHAAGVVVGAALLARRLHRLAALRRRAVRLDAGQPLAALHAATARRLGFRRAPALLVSAEAAVPFATGLLRPAVVLPARLAALPPDRLRPLLAHELAHLAGFDLPLAWLRAVAVTLWWPNPLAHALARRQEAAAEERCDDRVVAEGSAPPDYAASLLTAAELCAGRAAPFAAASGGQLEHRLRRLAGGPAPHTGRLATAALVAALALLLLPSAASGEASPAGWTARVLFAHPAPAASPPPGHRDHHGDHRLNHRHDHRHH